MAKEDLLIFYILVTHFQHCCYMEISLLLLLLSFYKYYIHVQKGWEQVGMGTSTPLIEYLIERLIIK